jgi:CBS domain containing-hemolysin-like protein
MNEDPSSRPAAAEAAADPVPPAASTPKPNGHRPDAEPAGGLFARLAARVFRGRPSLRDNLETALAAEIADGHAFSPEERTLLQNILRLREIRVEDVMVPRADIDAVEAGIALVDLIAAFRASGHSRMPIYRETLDDPIGMVHIKDLMTFIAAAAARPDAEQGPLDLGRVDLARPLADTGLVRPVLFVPASMPATDLMAKMQAARVQMALVIDEYGGTDGLVSLEDLVETVVGDIEDEHDDDDDEATIKPVADGVWVADARVALETVQDIIGDAFEVGAVGEEVDTLGGLIFALVGRIPVRGELISPKSLPGFEFEVLDADPRRIRRLRIYRRRGDRAGEARRRAPRRQAEMPASAEA